jgi:hypothetical protein
MTSVNPLDLFIHGRIRHSASTVTTVRNTADDLVGSA